MDILHDYCPREREQYLCIKSEDWDEEICIRCWERALGVGVCKYTPPLIQKKELQLLQSARAGRKEAKQMLKKLQKTH